MVEKIKELAKEKPWVIGLLLAIPVVFVIWLVNRRKGENEVISQEPAGMVYQPPAGGGIATVGTAGGGDEGGAGIVTVLSDFLTGLSEQQKAQREEMRSFLEAQAEAQKAFMEQIAGAQQSQMEAVMNAFSKITPAIDIPTTMPSVPEVPKREIYFSPTEKFSIPTGIVRPIDMPGASAEERWRQFDQTIVYDYLSSVAKEAQQRVLEYKAQWGQATSASQKAKIHQQAQADRQRIYQEITRGGGGFTASWVDTGYGYQELMVKTPKGEVIKI